MSTAYEFDTANNRRAMAGDRLGGVADRGLAPEPQATATQPSLDDDQLMKLVQSAYKQGSSYQQTVLQSRWSNSYAAYNNQHFAGSKYTTPRYRGRSRLFRPKTRAAVRRKAAEAAAALFSTSDVVIISGQNEGDQMQRASAAVVHELVNLRLDRSAENSGIPWFLTCMGAHMTGQISGICISKQYWEFHEKNEPGQFETVQVPNPADPTGQATIPQEQPVKTIIKDKPCIRLYPPEDIVRDPAANWMDQAQDSSYFILKNPMTLADAREYLKAVDKDGSPMFLQVSEQDLAAAAGIKSSESDTQDSTRRARETSGYDRFQDANVDREYQIVWLHENFFRFDGEDWQFWTLGTQKLISKRRSVREVYPEQGGARPITLGVSSLDPFKADPMSPVEAWSPVQQEINEVVNLRLDVMKQTVAPLTKVRRGRQINLKEVQNRTPDSVIYVDQMDDVEFDRPGAVGQEAFIEMERLNADFDDLAGTFSTGSVQTNRALNDTVGGMKLMNSSANAMGEFDLRIWIETWVEPVLRQLVKLEQYYESDEMLTAVAGDRAKLMQRFHMDRVTDELLDQNVQVRVNVGLGSADPMQRLQKLQAASQIALGIVGPSLQPRVKADEIIAEAFGAAGFKDNERFFYPGDDTDPRIKQLTDTVQQMTGALKDQQAERDNKVKVAQVGAVGRLINQHVGHLQGLENKHVDQAHQMHMGNQDAAIQADTMAQQQNFDASQADASRQADAALAPTNGATPPAVTNGATPPAVTNGAGPHGDIRELLGLPPADNAMAGAITQMADAISQLAMSNRQAQMLQMQAMQKLVTALDQGLGNFALSMEEGNAVIADEMSRNTELVVRSQSQVAAAMKQAAKPKEFTIRRGEGNLISSVKETRLQ